MSEELMPLEIIEHMRKHFHAEEDSFPVLIDNLCETARAAHRLREEVEELKRYVETQTEAMALGNSMKDVIENETGGREMRRVVCAAILARDGELLLGIRHYSQDMQRQIVARIDGYIFVNQPDENQGFVDQYGVWMSRKEAYQVAKEANQIIYPERCGQGLGGPKLYSEGLY